MKKRINRIGIFGGTFDPPHTAHLVIARQAKNQLNLSKVIFVPAYLPPHKSIHSTTAANTRLKMLRFLITDIPKFEISTIELHRKGISYTVDTLKTFHKQYPNAEIVLIIGADNLAQIQSWKSPHTILDIASIAVYSRRGYNQYIKKNRINAIHLKGPPLAISSTEVRKRIAKGLPIHHLVPPSIRKYIEEHSLYKHVASKGYKISSDENNRIHR